MTPARNPKQLFFKISEGDIWEVSGGARDGPNDEASGGGLVVSGEVSGKLTCCSSIPLLRLG